MKKSVVIMVSLAVLLLTPLSVSAQYKDKKSAEQTPKTEADILLEQAKDALEDAKENSKDKKVCKVMFEYQETYSVFLFSDVFEEVKDRFSEFREEFYRNYN